jgi:hypothetical protein
LVHGSIEEPLVSGYLDVGLVQVRLTDNVTDEYFDVSVDCEPDALSAVTEFPF